MDLLPSSQFMSKGKELQRLKGDIEFINVSFHYASRPTVPVLQHGVLRAVRSDLTTRRSAIVIAHRLSTIQVADKIVVMDSGRDVEREWKLK
ncbi:hypothetical protein L6164_027301 [Bauhinia variegata]|uniref:Uncharacterized protein n=1 Tax=Bauhinia variegata TaxID=167791 RepID=A0ACB9LSI2_BAUVA|nr:hypothetical protein L6164_027301 [Bauhinia variegata]